MEPLSSPGEWFHADGHLPAGSLELVATVGSPCLLESNGHSHPLIALGHGGHAAFTLGSRCFHLQSETAVILPRQGWTLVSEQGCSITLIPFDPLQLVTTARAMAPGSWEPPPAFDSPLNNGLSLPRDGDHQCSSVLIALNLLLPAFVQVGRLGETFLDAFLLQQQLYRLIAALAFPSLRDPQPSSTPLSHSASTDRRLEKVIDFIVLNLDQPLSLSVLVAKSNYSRRSIHYAFQERFHCSPMQWIRQQRMLLALQRLQEAKPGSTTVRAIASECGYNSLGRFYVDFQRAYRCRPSAVLRGTALQDQGMNDLQSRPKETGVGPDYDDSPLVPGPIHPLQPLADP
jgi:AraC-like DNA-binding protein